MALLTEKNNGVDGTLFISSVTIYVYLFIDWSSCCIGHFNNSFTFFCKDS